MAQLALADVSQFQGAVDWAAYAAGGYPAAIARLSYGTRIVDPQAAANLAGMRAHLRCRGWYHYLTAGDDPVAQAHFFCGILKKLLAGEFVIVDSEEGSGDQEARAALFLSTVNQVLGLSPRQDVEYSGLFFVAAHGGWIPGVTRWVAAYQPTEPQVGEALWQRTDHQTFPGIATPSDGSVFAGTVDQLLALITPPTPAGPATTPQEDPMLPMALANDGHAQYIITVDSQGKLRSNGLPAANLGAIAASMPNWGTQPAAFFTEVAPAG